MLIHGRMIYHDCIKKDVPKEVLTVSIDDREINWTYTPKFAKVYSKKREFQLRINKQLDKIFTNPERGKYMSHNRKGLLELYHESCRLYYTYNKIKNLVVIVEFSHKDYQ